MRLFAAIAVLACLCVGAIVAPLWFSAQARQEPTADPVYRSGGFVLRLTQEDCPFEELDADLTNRGIPPAKAYRTLTGDGRWAMPGCWAKDIDGDILTVDTAGGEGFIPKEWLTHQP